MGQLRSSSARPGTSLSLRRLAGLVVVLQGVRCALPRPHGASSNQLRAHVKWSFILALLSVGRACCECLKDWLVHLLLASCLFVNVRGSYVTIMCFAVHLKRLLCFLFAQADLTCTCGFRHLTPKLACSLLHRSAYSQGSLDICNPCRRRHLALLSSVASRWM